MSDLFTAGVSRKNKKAAAAGGVPTVVEYQPIGELGKWRVERWDLMVEEFEFGRMTADGSVIPGQIMPDLHQGWMGSVRAWSIVRRLFGVNPLRLPMGGNVNPADFTVLSRAAVCEKYGISKEDLAAELTMLRASAARILGSGVAKAMPGLASLGGEAGGGSSFAKATEDRGQADLLVEDGELLRRYGFPEKLFGPGDADREWFCGRIRDFERVLQDRMAGRVALQVLMNELRLRRLENALTIAEVKEQRALRKDVEDLEHTVERQLEKLNELAPWFSVTERGVTFAGCVGDLVRGIQEYQSHGTNRLIDGIFTATEVEVELRQSVQVPTPQYRLGLVTYLNAAKEGLMDPNWKPDLKERDLKILDEAFRSAVMKLSEESGKPIPDLERDEEFEELGSGGQ